MPTEQANQGSVPAGASWRSVWPQRLAVITALVFCLSLIFPLVAAFVTDKETWPAWWGVLDVAIAFVLALLALAVLGVAGRHVTKQAEAASYRTYRVLIHAIFAALVVFFLLGDRIVWSNCLTGFAWRAWLLGYCLPAWFTALRAGAPH
jgi:hypothetical protein